MIGDWGLQIAVWPWTFNSPLPCVLLPFTMLEFWCVLRACPSKCSGRAVLRGGNTGPEKTIQTTLRWAGEVDRRAVPLEAGLLRGVHGQGRRDPPRKISPDRYGKTVLAEPLKVVSGGTLTG